MFENAKSNAKNLEKYHKYYGIIRNKKFKYFEDKSMKKLCGIIDFDRVQCVIMIDDGEYSSDDENNIDDLSRFRIDVIGCKRKFIFKVLNSNVLKKWTQALYTNWNASKSFTLTNTLQMLDS